MPGLQKRLTALPPTLRSMKTDYTSLRSQVRNFSDFYGAAISDAKKQVCTVARLHDLVPIIFRRTNPKEFISVFLSVRFQQLSVRCLKPTKIFWRNIERRLHCAGSTTSSWWSLKVYREINFRAENKICVINWVPCF